jgi:hypothetical protein
MKRLFIAFSALLALTGLVKAQTPSGQILGVITDSSGAVVSKAVIAATNLNTNLISRTTSDDQGNYLLTNVAPGI